MRLSSFCLLSRPFDLRKHSTSAIWLLSYAPIPFISHANYFEFRNPHCRLRLLYPSLANVFDDFIRFSLLLSICYLTNTLAVVTMETNFNSYEEVGSGLRSLESVIEAFNIFIFEISLFSFIRLSLMLRSLLSEFFHYIFFDKGVFSVSKATSNPSRFSGRVVSGSCLKQKSTWWES